MRIIVRIIIPVLLALGLAAVVSWFLGADDLRQCADGPQPSGPCRSADAIIAISGGDTYARTNEAVRLYRAGWALKLIFSGAALDRSGISNARAMSQQAMQAGVPPSAIAVDEQSANTAANASNVRAIVHGLSISRVILVTSPYHQRRASIEFSRALGTNVTILNHPTPNDHLWPSTWWLTVNGWLLAVTELGKLIYVIFTPGS